MSSKLPATLETVWNCENFQCICNFEEMCPDVNGYPLLPNGNNEWRFDEASFKKNTVKHFSNWALKTIAGKYVIKNNEKIRYEFKRCMGVLSCIKCNALFRPKIKDTEETISARTCCVCFSSLKWIHCDAALKFEYNLAHDKIVIKHQSIHNHDCPPVSKPDFESKKKFSKIVKLNPAQKPLQLVVGTLNPLEKNQSVSHLHEAFLNRDRTAYYRRVVLEEMGYSFNGNDFFSSLKTFQSRFSDSLNFFSGLQLNKVYLSCCTNFQLSRLSDTSFFGRTIGGIITDATYNFFKNGYLLSSSVYCFLLHRWVPILFTWIEKLNAETHEEHFLILFHQISKNVTSIKKQDELIFSVMDYSQAQRAGFVSAYSKFRQVDIAVAKETCKQLLRGCVEHYRASITRISRNNAIVSINQKDNFCSLALSLLKISDILEYEQVISNLLSQFPNCKKWLKWWITPEHRQLIFPSFQDKTLGDKPIVETTNAQEAMHSIYYQLYDDKCELFVGLTVLILFSKYLEDCYKKVKAGAKLCYGQPEPWKKIAEKYGTTKKYRKTTLKNDGRPPDTTEKLLENVFPKRKRGRPVGATTVQKNPLISYQSYIHSKNTCYLTSLLECLFAVYQELKLEILSDSDNSTIVQKIFNHFKTREHISESKEGNLNSCLKLGLDIFSDWVIREKKMYKENEFGSIVEVLDLFIQESGTTFMQNTEIVKSKCPNHPGKIFLRNIGVLHLSILLMQSASCEVDPQLSKYNLQKFLDIYKTNGIQCASQPCREAQCDCRTQTTRVLHKLSNILIFSVDIHSISTVPSDNHFYFPETLTIGAIQYSITARIQSLTKSGTHFNCLVKKGKPSNGIYFFDDMKNKGYAHLVNQEISGCIPLTSMVFYVQSNTK